MHMQRCVHVCLSHLQHEWWWCGHKRTVSISILFVFTGFHYVEACKRSFVSVRTHFHVQPPSECETRCRLRGAECRQSEEDTEGRCVVSPWTSLWFPCCACGCCPCSQPDKLKLVEIREASCDLSRPPKGQFTWGTAARWSSEVIVAILANAWD